MGSKPDKLKNYSSLETMIQQSPARNFAGAFTVTATLMPVAATLLTVAVYFAISQFSYSRLTSIAVGAVLTLIFWSAMAILFSPRTTAMRSDRYRYTLLTSWFKHQEHLVKIFKERTRETEMTSNPQILADAEAAFAAFLDRLIEVRPGADWALGTGYIELSRNLHKVDEALILMMPGEYVIEVGGLLKAEIANSKISNPEQKLPPLETALDDLIFFYQKLDDKEVQTDSSEDTLNKSVKKVIREREARGTIRGVSRSLHEFEEDQEMRQVNFRIALNRLTLLTGLALYILLMFAILTGVPLPILTSVTCFALIGACTGLLGRLYEQAKADTAVDSTSLASVRLMALPVLSGLAAIGGVALLQKVATTSGDFSFILTPFTILAAAAFGLAPNLFFNALQRQIDAIDKGK